MTVPKLLAATLLAGAFSTHAATPVYLVVDHSTQAVMDKAGAQAVWREQLDAKLVARLAKLYPVGKWGFLSQVEGGFTADKACVITARAMLLPRSGKRMVFVPGKSATAFDHQPGATVEQCQALARTKLTEAIVAMRSSLVAP